MDCFEDALLKDIPYRLHNLTEASITLLVRLLPAPLWFIRTSQRIVLRFENALNLSFVIYKYVIAKYVTRILPSKRKNSYF